MNASSTSTKNTWRESDNGRVEPSNPFQNVPKVSFATVYKGNIIKNFGIDARIVLRKNHHVVYMKEGAQIVEMLGIMEANIALMNLENVRILKEMRGSVNRKVNCETANINKTVSAAIRQIEDIRYIEETTGFSSLPEPLEQMARLRLQYPEASLLELGKMLTPVVGKSGVNHRLRKLKEIAEDLRRKQGGEVL